MKIPAKFKEYIWLVNTIRKARRITFAEINEKWLQTDMKQRWYILGHFHRDATEEKPESDYFGVFSFDRILEMSMTDIKFKIDPDFDAQDYFKES